MSSMHKKESTEKDAGFVHTKMSAKNVIPFVHHMVSDHNVLASETRAYERLKEEISPDEELDDASMLRVKSAHISTQGHAYERSKEEVPFRESTEEEVGAFIGFRLRINSSSQTTVRVIVVVASAWVTCMLWQ